MDTQRRNGPIHGVKTLLLTMSKKHLDQRHPELGSPWDRKLGQASRNRVRGSKDGGKIISHLGHFVRSKGTGSKAKKTKAKRGRGILTPATKTRSLRGDSQPGITLMYHCSTERFSVFGIVNRRFTILWNRLCVQVIVRPSSSFVLRLASVSPGIHTYLNNPYATNHTPDINFSLTTIGSLLVGATDRIKLYNVSRLLWVQLCQPDCHE